MRALPALWLLMLFSPEPPVSEPLRPPSALRDADRRAMVEEVARYDHLASTGMGRPALSPAVLEAPGRAPRHLFVPADRVIVHEGDGYAGLPDLAPFDGVIVTAAPDHVPGPLLEQIASGGRLEVPVGTAGGHQELLVLTKGADGAVHRERVTGVRFVPLTRDAGKGH